MNSGKTTNKPNYTREEKIQFLFQYQRQASEAFIKAGETIVAKLKKEGIPLEEFVKYSIEQELQLIKQSSNPTSPNNETNSDTSPRLF